MRVGFDIDGVMADFQGGWASAYELWWPGKLDWTKLDTWDSIETQTHFHNVGEFWAWTDVANVWRRLQVVDGAQGALYDLQAAGVMIELITNRSDKPHVVADTYDWLDDNFGFIHNLPGRIHHTRDKGSVRCSLYVDDSPYVLESLSKQGMPAVRYSRPWNDGEVPCIATVRNWAEVKAFIEKEMR